MLEVWRRRTIALLADEMAEESELRTELTCEATLLLMELAFALVLNVSAAVAETTLEMSRPPPWALARAAMPRVARTVKRIFVVFVVR